MPERTPPSDVAPLTREPDDISFIFEPRPPLVEGTALPNPQDVREYLWWLDHAAACRAFAEIEAGGALCR